MLRGKIKLKPCSVCGILRRYMMNGIAREEGANFLATGHNLDDEVQAFIMNIIRGNIRGIVQEGIVTKATDPKLIARIKPLYFCLDKEMRLYVELRSIKHVKRACPYVKFSVRGFVRDWLNQLEGRIIERFGDVLGRKA
ncbi:MAG: hypothetical protein DRM97_00955 [Thermoprotei archaeon]|nr:MAG: hypothetical protein DRM97_00955 [Thermoprotei archaeon]